MSNVMVTGGLGFIGSAVVRQLIDGGEHRVLNVDKATYAATSELGGWRIVGNRQFLLHSGRRRSISTR